MNVESMLLEYTHIPEMVRKLNRELNDIIQNKNETYNTLQSSKITGMPHGTEVSNITLKAVEKLIDRYEVRVKSITEEINYLIDLKENIEKAIRILSLEERRIIELRFFNSYKWKRIQYIVKYSRSQCFDIHNKAINKLKVELEKFGLNRTFYM